MFIGLLEKIVQFQAYQEISIRNTIQVCSCSIYMFNNLIKLSFMSSDSLSNIFYKHMLYCICDHIQLLIKHYRPSGDLILIKIVYNQHSKIPISHWPAYYSFFFEDWNFTKYHAFRVNVYKQCEISENAKRYQSKLC